MPRAYWVLDPELLNPQRAPATYAYDQRGLEFHETIEKQWACPNPGAGNYRAYKLGRYSPELFHTSPDVYKPLVIRVLGGQRLLELPTQAALRGTYPVCQTCPNQLSCMASDVDHNYKLYLTKAQRGMSPHPERPKR